MKKMLMTLALATVLFGGFMATTPVYAQEEGAIVNADGSAANTDAAPQETSFWGVVVGGGLVGMILWFALFGSGAFAAYFIVDGYILVRPKKVMPEPLIDGVKAALDEGDVMKAMELCENDPSSMAKMLQAGFAHIEDGFEVIDEAISAAADLEIEQMMQRLNWISVCGSLAPMLGLLGTVQGMILTFATIAISGVQIGPLSLTISQALYTTAGGLVIAIPSVTFFYVLRNSANRLVLRMSVVTADLIKNLRNVEVVEA